MCPFCHSKNVRRSHARLWEFPFLLFLGRPMRCRVCFYRYFRWPWSLSALPARPAQPPINLTAFKPPQKRSAAAAAAGKG
jgi:hypothetical protein